MVFLSSLFVKCGCFMPWATWYSGPPALMAEDPSLKADGLSKCSSRGGEKGTVKLGSTDYDSSGTGA